MLRSAGIAPKWVLGALPWIFERRAIDDPEHTAYG